MPEDDQAVTEPASSEEGPLQEGTTESANADEPEGRVASSEDTGAATTPAEPAVDWQAKYAQLEAESQKRFETHDELMSRLQQTEGELQRYQQAEEAVLQEIQADKDKWVEAISDPQQGQKLIDQMVAQRLRQRDATLQATTIERQSAEAAVTLQNFAMKDAEMTPDEYQRFLQENSVVMPNGQLVPFGGMSPAQALKAGKGLIRDLKHEHFAKQVKIAADKAADDKAKKKIAQQAPSAGPVGTPAEKSPGDQFLDEVIGEPGEDNIESWL